MSTNLTVAEDIFNKIEELILNGTLKKGRSYKRKQVF